MTNAIVPISPGNIVSAALLTQLSVIVIVFVGTLFRGDYESADYLIFERSQTKVIFGYTLLMAILTISIIVFTDASSATWRVMMRDVQFNGIAWQSAILGVWILDIVTLAILVGYTGGAASSPFTSLYFVFPTIALFLHEPRGHVIAYTFLVIFLYSFTLIPHGGDSRRDATISQWIVSISCFALTVWIGMFTRP
jgi:hypothetical protein